MAAQDTIIGIVGAVALVAVMVGVFVYEYNNTDDGGDGAGGSGGGAGAMVVEAAGLSPEGDIDGDGVANADDDDVDGDGVMNADDDDVKVIVTMSGTLGPRLEPIAAPDGGMNVMAGEGIIHMVATLTASPTSPDPTGITSGFQLTATHDDGTGFGSASGAGTLVIDTMDVYAGTIDVDVKPTQGSLGGGYDLTVELHYG